MKTYISGSLKVLMNYGIILLIFIIFLPAGLNSISIYSWVIFILMLLLLYSDFNSLALKERKPAYNIVNYPLKGLIMGAAGFLPIIIIALVLNLADFGSENANIIKNAILKVITAPLFGFLTENLLLLLIIPVVVGLAYLAGHYGKELPRIFKSKPRKKVVRKQ